MAGLITLDRSLEAPAPAKASLHTSGAFPMLRGTAAVARVRCAAAHAALSAGLCWLGRMRLAVATPAAKAAPPTSSIPV
jgi:hypothetical protein